PAARAISSGLEQKVLLITTIESPLDDMCTRNLRPVISGFEVGGRAPPGQASVYADHWRVVPVHVDCREAAGPEVPQVAVRNAELLVEVHPAIHIRCIVDVPDRAGADFCDQRRAENMAEVEAGTLIAGRSCGVEAIVRGPAVDPQSWPIQPGIRHGGLLVAIADKCLVLGVDHVIYFDVELVDGLRLIVRDLDIVRKRGTCRRRQKTQELLGDGTDS